MYLEDAARVEELKQQLDENCRSAYDLSDKNYEVRKVLEQAQQATYTRQL